MTIEQAFKEVTGLSVDERKLLLKELIDEIEKMRKDFFVFDDERKVISCVSHNSALKEIQELIRKKM